jgi:predicted metal-dependent peptidase
MVLDTSGSVGQDQLNYFAAKATSVLEEYNTILHIVYCDTKAYYGGEVRQEDLPLNLKAVGFGGTDFQPPFKMVDEMGINPACLIYLTDMQCSSFPEEPGYPVLWAVYDVYGKEEDWIAPFGEVVDVNPEEGNL